MTIILYSDQKMEKNVELCIQSLKNKDLTNIKFVYYTIGFDSSIIFKNLIKHRIDHDSSKYNMWYYKPELCLNTIDLYTDDYYLYLDCDVIFSRRFNFDLIKNNEDYPLCPYGPFEYPFITYSDFTNGENYWYTDFNLMNYFNIEKRSMRYVWAALFSFNNKCKDFFEEQLSILTNKYLLKKQLFYFPFGDETALNVVLWKRKADKNLGFSMLNTHMFKHVEFIEQNDVVKYNFRDNLTAEGEDWQSVEDSKNILFYHGFKDIEETLKTVNFINND